MKKVIAVTTAAILIVGFSTVSATAGAARRHTIEGIVIGTSVALLGAAIYNEIHRDHPSPVVVHHRGDRDRYNAPGHRHRAKHEYTHHKRHHKKFKSRGHGRGHWENSKVWVAPVYKEKWKPGHYNRRGRWVAGGYKRILIQDGYYTREKVWVRQ